ARVFNNAGQPVNITNDLLPYGAVVGYNEGEFVVNSTTAGYQEFSAVGMLPWAETGKEAEGVYYPRFVVAWQGPNKAVGEEIEDESTEGGTTSGTTSGTTTGGTTGGSTGLLTTFVGPYTVFYKVVGGGRATEIEWEPDIVVKGLGERYNTSSDSASDGFYRPVDVNVDVATAADQTAAESSSVVILGTDGDDEVVVTTGANGVVSIAVNGVAQTIAAGAQYVEFKGLGGNDTIVCNVASGLTVGVDSSAKAMSINGAVVFKATGVANYQLTGQAGAALNLVAKSKTDAIRVDQNAVAWTADGFALSAASFCNVSAIGDSYASVILVGAEGSDELNVDGSSVVLTGAGYEFSAKGFGATRVNAGEGADVANFAGVQKLSAAANSVVAFASGSTIVAFGFENVDAAVAGGLTLNGSAGDDYAKFDGASVEFRYANGSVLTANGFTKADVFGMAGADEILFANASGKFEGGRGKATLSGVANVSAEGFERVVVSGDEAAELSAVLSASNVLASADKTSVAVESEGALYAVIAADRVKVKRDSVSGDAILDKADELDYIFETENWDF
ncbi:MAG: hypothetical protein HUK22_05230, partial [Thermoguttaceae bacterium]|nr:hypothetical protein [Thermoguttaceae bacterium]